MSPFRVLALGVGDAFSARYYSSCLALEAEGTWLLIDCPHPIRKILAEASAAAGLTLDVGDFRSIVLTHLHADHCSGLEGFAFYSYFRLQRKVQLVTHAAIAARLWDATLAGGMDCFMSTDFSAPIERREIKSYFDVTPLTESQPLQVGPFRIECRKTIHSVPTTALRIQAGGRTLGYSCDTAYDPSLIDWLSSADRIIHETNLGIHTPYEKLIALPAEVRQKMLLIHYPDGFDVDASLIEAARPGKMYQV